MIFLDAIVSAGLFIENNRNTYITILYLSFFSYKYEGIARIDKHRTSFEDS